MIDTTTNERVADVEVGQSPVQVAFSPDGATAYVSLNAVVEAGPEITREAVIAAINTAGYREITVVESAS